MNNLEEEYELYHEALKIDKHNLDDEVIGQQSLYVDVGAIYANLVSMYDRAKEEVKIVDARIYVEIRRDPKVSDAQAVRELLLDERHITAVDEIAVLRELMEKWESLKNAFDKRSRMLEQLVYLHTSGYWVRDSFKHKQPSNRSG